MASNQQIRFIQYAQPQLDDGNYQLTVSQTVSSVSGAMPETIYKDTKRFAVSGERFSLNPSSLVSVFPPEFSLGEFSNVLPHVVLSRKTLPWERSAGTDKNVEVNDIPWLGVFVFNQDDPVPPSSEVTLLDLLPIDKQTSTGTPGNMPLDTYFPPFTLDYGEAWSDKCIVVDVNKDLFNAIAPTQSDLGWLSHVKEVDVTSKSESYLKKLSLNLTDTTATTFVAEVVGNRFATPGKKCTVHLVCLEDFGPVLPGAGNVSNLPAGITTVRLVSLKSWTFSTVSENYTFAGLLTNINKLQQNTLNTLQVPFTASGSLPGDTAVSNALAMGFSAFNHRTRMGDNTVSWMRGPFTPYNRQSSLPFPGNVSDEFTVYNPDSGMLDVSYSAAWQLGRLLALQNGSFATALYNWKRALTKAVIQAVEQQFLNLSYSTAAALVKETLSNYVNPIQAGDARATSQTPASGSDLFLKNVRRNKHARLKAIHDTLSSSVKLHELFEQNTVPVEVPYVIANFLARLKLLYGIPFNYLVPDERMLPLESLRFFYMDSAWVEALIEGAFSIGNSTSGDGSLSKALIKMVHPVANKHAASLRKSLFGKAGALQNNIPPIANPTGFLLRSQAVTGWPGMEVHGFDAQGNALDLLRFEQVGPGVMICFFNGVVNQVKIQQHPEALHFGVDENIQHPAAPFTKSFRYITRNDPHNPGDPVTVVPPELLSLPDYYRSTTSSVVEIDTLAAAFKTSLSQNSIYTGVFTSAEFALEMIEGVQEVVFNFTP